MDVLISPLPNNECLKIVIKVKEDNLSRKASLLHAQNL